MEPILSNVANKSGRNEPHDLLSRLYREIGISAVAAALQVSGGKTERETARAKRDALRSAA